MARLGSFEGVSGVRYLVPDGMGAKGSEGAGGCPHSPRKGLVGWAGGVLNFLPLLGHFYLDCPRDLSKAACPADTWPFSQVSPRPTCLAQCRTSPPLLLTSTPAHTLCALPLLPRPSGESEQSQAKSHAGDATMKGKHKPLLLALSNCQMQ